MKKLLLQTLTAALAGLLALPAAAQWSSNSQVNTVVQDAAGNGEITPLTATLSDGSTYVAWFEAAPTIRYQMRLQRLDVNGNKLWGNDGMVVSANQNGTAVYRYDLKVDQQNNAILGFQDTRSGSNQCVVYKISPTGTQLWGANGIPLLDSNATSGLSPSIGITNSNNVVVSWNSSSASGSWISFQKFSPSGTALWPAVQRIQDPSFAARYNRPYPMPAGTDDILLNYARTTGTGVGVSILFAQRYDATGTAVWAAPTQVSSQAVGFTFFPQPVIDGAGGYFVALNSGNSANANLGDVYVQRVSGTGALPWGTVGTPALLGTATARFDGLLQYNPTRNELWLALTVTNTQQTEAGVSLQKYDISTGATLLGGAGTTVQPTSTALASVKGFRDTGSGLLLIYTEALSTVNNALKATKRTYTGGPAWSSGVVAVSSVASTKSQYSMGAFLNDQLVLSWQDNRQGAGIYAQNVRNDGQLGVVLGTRAPQSAQPLQLYPNPGAAPSLRLDLPRAQTVTLSLRDAQGRLVQQQHVTLPTGTHTVPLRAEGLAAGLYLVEASATDGPRWRGQWVKP